VFGEGAEIGAALGGCFLRVTWDENVNPGAPFLTVVDADVADPEFAWGRLRAVTFWHVVRQENQRVWRHLERHELAPDGTGLILHGLYEGTVDNLGRVVPLTDSTATAGLAEVVDAESKISTGSPGLAVVYVPNVRPQRRWRKDPVGRYLGRSDLDGVEGLMDALDEVYTLWMRDLDAAKARIIAASSVLEDFGPGQGAGFDSDRAVFTPINALASRAGEGGGLPIEVVEFNLQVEKYSSTAQQLLEGILRTAGYSQQTFGEGQADSSVTATEVNSRDQRSLMTRDRKIRAWTPPLATALEKLLAVDAALFSSGVTPARPNVVFPEGVQPSLLQLAQTAQALGVAEAASVMVHPEWDEQQVTEEVGRIMAERGTPVPDPTGLLPDGGAAGQLSPEELAVMVQKIYLGVGTVLTSEEARDIINRAGGQLTGPAPVQPGE
jgi:hypothetical protein